MTLNPLITVLFLAVPVVVALICLALMQSERQPERPRWRVGLLVVAVLVVFFTLLWIAYAGCSSMGSG
jgi:hypothetical protein